VRLAQAFARFGAAVTVFDRVARILPKEDPDAAAIVHRQLVEDGITLHLRVRLIEAETTHEGVRLRYEHPSGMGQIVGDRVLVAAGRAPNVEALGLDAAGVRTSQLGVLVDDRLRTLGCTIVATHAGEMIAEAAYALTAARCRISQRRFILTRHKARHCASLATRIAAR
jgi:pyruvate/2-oxoglutarate dehydrogenase complex dihydrolipoamide dehydrogenase (E3) component